MSMTFRNSFPVMNMHNIKGGVIGRAHHTAFLLVLHVLTWWFSVSACVVVDA